MKILPLFTHPQVIQNYIYILLKNTKGVIWHNVQAAVFHLMTVNDEHRHQVGICDLTKNYILIFSGILLIIR